MRSDPDPGNQTQRLDVGREARHAVWECFVYSGPVARSMAAFVGFRLPTVVDLYVPGTVVLQVFRDPVRIAFDFVFVDVLVVVVPGAQAGWREWENGLVDRLEELHPQGVAVVVLHDRSVLQRHLVFGWIIDPVRDVRLYVAEGHDEQVFVVAVPNARRNRMRPCAPGFRLDGRRGLGLKRFGRRRLREVDAARQNQNRKQADQRPHSCSSSEMTSPTIIMLII